MASPHEEIERLEAEVAALEAEVERLEAELKTTKDALQNCEESLAGTPPPEPPPVIEPPIATKSMAIEVIDPVTNETYTGTVSLQTKEIL